MDKEAIYRRVRQSNDPVRAAEAILDEYGGPDKQIFSNWLMEYALRHQKFVIE